MKDDERELLIELQKRTAAGERPRVITLVKELGMNEKRAEYICEKWSGRGWYDYGFHALWGWLTQEGRDVKT